MRTLILADRMANIGNGRFGGVGPHQHWAEPVSMIMEQTRAGLAPVPAALREWVEEAVEAIARGALH